MTPLFLYSSICPARSLARSQQLPPPRPFPPSPLAVSRSRPLHFGPPWQSRGPIIGKSVSSYSALRAGAAPSALPDPKFKCGRVEIFKFRTRCGAAACLREFRSGNCFSSSPLLLSPLPSPSLAVSYPFFGNDRLAGASTGHAKITRCATGERRRSEEGRASRAGIFRGDIALLRESRDALAGRKIAEGSRTRPGTEGRERGGAKRAASSAENGERGISA